MNTALPSRYQRGTFARGRQVIVEERFWVLGDGHDLAAEQPSKRWSSGLAWSPVAKWTTLVVRQREHCSPGLNVSKASVVGAMSK